jgi:S1-C subfamily serine protease
MNIIEPAVHLRSRFCGSLEVPSRMNRPAQRWTPSRLALVIALLAIGAVMLVSNRTARDTPVSPTIVQHDDASNPPLDPTTYRVQLPPLETLHLTDAERSSLAVAAVEAVAPAVVVIHRVAREGQFDRTGRDDGERIGSGVVIDTRGYIIASLLTTGLDGRIRITYANGQTVDASVVRIDELLQLVLLKVDEPPPAAATLATYAPRPGEPVLAIGSPLEDFSSTVTGGVIGAIGVTLPGSDVAPAIPGAMQHDAATNPGNEGGPLVDLHGRVIGINVGAISVSAHEIVQGWSFAIPATSLGPLLAELD